MKTHLRRWLESDSLPYGLALAALLLTLPALGAGLQFDDYYHRQVLLGAASPAAPMRLLFAFLDGDPAQAQRLMDSGVFPWWTLPAAREAFWRPLSALTHWLDYRLWPNHPALMHAHSLLWFGALVAAAAALYRRLAPSLLAAGLAALLYALDDAHGFAAGWLANRNGLLAALFGVLCLQAYLRWRRDAWRPGAVLAPLWLALGLLSAEAALGALAYVAAYALCLDRAPWRGRLRALLPLALVAVGWAGLYRALGYGAWGTAYVDPLREPLAFARVLLERAPVLLLAQFAGPPAEVYPFLAPALRLAVWAAALLVSAGLAWLFAPLVRHSPTARFWATGLLLALLPVSAALPANRLLFFTGLGAFGLLAEWLSPSLAPRPVTESPVARKKSVVRRLSSFILGLSSFVLLLIHVVIAPLLLPVAAFSPALLGHLEPAALGVDADPAHTVVLLNAPSFFSASFLGLIRSAHGLPLPARVRYLGAGPAALSLSRPDARTLLVTPAGGYLTGFDPVFRGAQHPLRLGDTIALAGLTVAVRALTADGRPATAAFRFDVPLEDASLRWYAWRGGVFVPAAPPAVGQTLSLPPLNLLSAAP
jgi:hypothetical protein